MRKPLECDCGRSSHHYLSCGPALPVHNRSAISRPDREELFSEVIANAQAIHTNARALPHKIADHDEYEKILMELRHDLSDALKCVQILQERLDAYQ